MKKNRGSNHSLQKKASAAVGSCLRSVRLPALLVLFLILFSFIFINTNYRNNDVSALPNAAASPDNDLSFFDTMPATPAPNNAGSVYQNKYEIVPGKVYKLGDCDKHVSDMQQRLMLLGYLPSDEPSDVFNKPLEQAVKLFQRANHLAQSGEADETLLRLLYSDAPAEYVIEYGNVGNDVRMLQERLMQLGYYSEKINGYFGTATRTAVEQFRLSNNLPESSVVDTEAFNLIFSAYAVDDGNLPFETGEPYYTVSPAPSPVLSSLPTPAASPTPTLPPAPASTPSPKPTAIATASAAPTAAPTPSPRPTPTPKPTPTPSPTPPPAPTPTTAPAPSQGLEQFINALYSQLGKPYVFGSSGPDSFDCSGLVYYCLRQAGLNIGRLNAAGYSNYAGWQRIDGKENLIRGDLVFFYDDAYSRISHVGVYLGNNSFLHASATAGSVVISNAGNWFNTHLAWGRRVF